MKKISEKAKNMLRVYYLSMALGAATALTGCSGGKVMNDGQKIESVNYEELLSYMNANGLSEHSNNAYVEIVANDFDTLMINQIESNLAEGKNVGLVIRPYWSYDDKLEYSDIYDMIDLVKHLVTNYKINLPIYLDVDMFYGREAMGIQWAKIFSSKLLENGCYVGLTGSDSFLSEFIESYNNYSSVTNANADFNDIMPQVHFDNIYEFDCGTWDNIMLFGQSMMSGCVFSRYDLSKVIEMNGYNDSQNFVLDYSYVVQSGDTLSEICVHYGNQLIDYDFVAEYNNLSDSYLIRPGDKISFCNRNSDGVDYLDVKNSSLLKGIDVSHHQSKQSVDSRINWEIVGQQVDFAIVRIGDVGSANQIDADFHYNISECKRLGIPVGVYWFSHATTPQEMIGETNLYLSQLEQYGDLELPVFIDFETSEQNNLVNNDLASALQVVHAGLVTIQNAGYYPGVYAGGKKAIFGKLDNLNNHPDFSYGIAFWPTNGSTYDILTSYSDFVSPGTLYTPHGGVPMTLDTIYDNLNGNSGSVIYDVVQFGSKGYVNGIREGEIAMNDGYNAGDPCVDLNIASSKLLEDVRRFNASKVSSQELSDGFTRTLSR